MPRKYQAAKETSNNFGFSFVNTRLTAEQATEFRQWSKDNISALVALVTELLGDGYKLSFTYDHNNDCFICSLTGVKGHPINGELVLTSRSDDWQEAILLSAWKHFILFQGRRWETTETRPNWG